MPPESGPSHNPVSEGNPFRNRGIDPDTGEPVTPEKPGTFVAKYLGKDAGHAVDELVGQDKVGGGSKKEAAKDLRNLLTPEEQEAATQTEEQELLDLLPKLAEQYKAQVEILQNRGYLGTLDDGKEGIIDIKGNEHVLPGLEQITQRLIDKNKETKGALETKLEQGFTKIVIVPFGRSLSAHLGIYKQTILDHYQVGQQVDGTSTLLLGADGNPLPAILERDGSITPALDPDTPFWIWDELTKGDGADIAGTMVYNSTQFDKDKHGGVTKAELLKQDPKQAFQIYLLQQDPNIPRAGKGKAKAGRKQLEAGESPKAYLDTFQQADTDPDNPYHLEQGLTPEAALTLATLALDETNQVLGDFEAKDASNNPLTSISFLTGAYLPSLDRLLRFGWARGSRQADLYGGQVEGANAGIGAHSAVRI